MPVKGENKRLLADSVGEWTFGSVEADNPMCDELRMKGTIQVNLSSCTKICFETSETLLKPDGPLSYAAPARPECYVHESLTQKSIKFVSRLH